VQQILANVTLPKNLTFVPPTDYDSLNDQVAYYFLLAAIIIIVVLLSFCR
jgi:hypothetical protein